MQTGSDLTRYRSAPSSYFTSLAAAGDGDGFGDDDFAQFFNPRASSPETQRIFMNSTPAADAPAKHEPQPSGEYSSSSSTAPYHQHPGQNSEENLQIKMEGGGAGLIRHSSSPAGFFADINIETGRFNSPMPKAKPYTMAPISEIINKPTTATTDPFDRRFDDHGFIADYINSWDESALLSDDLLEGPSDKDGKRFPNSEVASDQGNEGWNHPATLLSHHLSLPSKMSAELSMEKLLQDSVPCKMRAKRGCATHPRSIAERVRRTKISARIRKLQELVPNMEKQTNTSDMLDFAVDYIKDLQGQVKKLSENREKCTCPAKHMS